MIRGLLLALTIAISVLAIPVQAQVPTAEQLEMLRSLTPEDREALMEQLGLSGAVIDGSPRDDSMRGSSRNTRRSGEDDREERSSEERGSEEERLVRSRILRAEDSLLIDIDLKKGTPPRVESPGEGLPPITVPGEEPPEFLPEERKRLEELVALVRSRNPYQLDSQGRLELPGFSAVVLEGLDGEQASKRLSAIVQFQKLDVKVTKLPIRKIGVAGLKPFGYDLFKRSPSTFAPVTDVPVPADYVVGPGDQCAALRQPES